jgi:response regulator RpfG family c-di-GMP phosphodiesterase
MTLFDVLAFYGAIGDAACGNPRGFAVRKAAAAVSLATVAGLDDERDALYFAGLLHAIGAIDSPAYRDEEPHSERFNRLATWDVPVRGARICSELGVLPEATADLIRWQAERWDGTGFPDQLRWQGIPSAAGLLALADAFVRANDPDEALVTICSESGRAYGPELTRIFTAWYHRTGAEIGALEAPAGALPDVPEAAIVDVFDGIADSVDAHNATPRRWRRVADLAERVATSLSVEPAQRVALSLASRTYGCGELAAPASREDTFDPLARLGIEERARLGVAAASFAAGNATLYHAAPVLEARSEWFDGSGSPQGLRGDEIPLAARILSAAIAYDALDRKDRIKTAAGTQFDPRVVNAIVEVSKVVAF